jgi:hypothetical protein
MTEAIRKQLEAHGVAQERTKRVATTLVPASANEAIVAQEITFDFVVPGNNGAAGLIRMHWTKRQSLGGLFGWKVRAAQLRPMLGPVRLELTRYSIGPQMDYDNLVSTGKLPIDALVRGGILPDDKPAVIAERTYTQLRAESKASQRTVIRLTQL